MMQETKQVFESMANVFADERVRRLVQLAMKSSKTAEQLSEGSGIPLGSCYREIHRLLEENLLKVDRYVVTRNGKKFAVYRCNLRSAEFGIRDGDFEVNLMFDSTEHSSTFK